MADIALEVAKCEVCARVGPFGCGKTALLRVIAAQGAPDRGSITNAGRDVLPLPPHQRGIAMVFQNGALFPNLTVEDNIAFGLQQPSRHAADLAARVAAMTDLMKLGPNAKSRPVALSGGQRQRVAFAQALERQRLLDVPLSALDAQIRKRLYASLGVIAVFVTHDQKEALALGDGVAFMRAIRIVQPGSPHEV